MTDATRATTQAVGWRQRQSARATSENPAQACRDGDRPAPAHVERRSRSRPNETDQRRNRQRIADRARIESRAFAQGRAKRVDRGGDGHIEHDRCEYDEGDERRRLGRVRRASSPFLARASGTRSRSGASASVTPAISARIPRCAKAAVTSPPKAKKRRYPRPRPPENSRIPCRGFWNGRRRCRATTRKVRLRQLPPSHAAGQATSARR